MQQFGAHPVLCTGSFSVPELVKADGRIVVLSSGAAQYRTALYSEYCLSKHALNRLAELVVVGTYPSSRMIIGKIYLLTTTIFNREP